MDYSAKTRMKIFGRAKAVEAVDDPELMAALAVDGYQARVERAVLIQVEAFDWNCRQHIPELYPREEVLDAVQSLRDRIAELERENAKLRGSIGCE